MSNTITELKQNRYYQDLIQIGYAIFMQKKGGVVLVSMKKGDIATGPTEYSTFLPQNCFEAILMHQKRSIEIQIPAIYITGLEFPKENGRR